MNLRGRSGFVLVLTLLLLALLVLVTFGLGTLNKIGSEVAATSVYQTQARQNALLGLDMAMGELQRFTGDDEVLTGMAGITGVPVGAGNPGRQWCGVWDRNGQLMRWLASGQSGTAIPLLTGSGSIALMANGSLGADGPDKEHVRVRLIPVNSLEGGVQIQQGSLAYWVGDEGVKLSAVIPADEAPVIGQKHAINLLRDLSALLPDAPNIARALTYEQLALVPASPLSAGKLQANLHALGRTHQGYIGATRMAGLLNLNSNSENYWTGIAATYDRLKMAGPNLDGGFAATLRDQFYAADPVAGKLAGGPYSSVDLFLESTALTLALAGNVTPEEFGNVMRPWLTTRSDTFRIRSYGEALNPAEAARIEATACCEATVQRVKDDPAASTGRYVITAFRWFSADAL